MIDQLYRHNYARGLDEEFRLIEDNKYRETLTSLIVN